MKERREVFVRRLVFSLLVMAGCAFTQEFRGTLSGRVTDPSGAGVPSAKIAVIQTETNARSQTVSGPDGSYTVPFLAPGVYQVEAEAGGFSKYVRSGVRVSAVEHVVVDVALEVGSSAQTLEVHGDASPVDTENASQGQVITSQQAEDLPVNGRNPMALARTAYGVIPKEKHALTEVRPFDNSGAGDFSLGGANSNSNEYLLNGVPNMVDGSRTVAYSPLLDAVDEVRVDEFQTDAAYGDTLGGTVNLTTKSGTNNFHGALLAFNETSALAANPFFLNAAGQKQAVTRQNEYGGTIGGPVLLPKIYNGKNKLFFFFAYEGFQDSTPASSTSAVPTDAERQGNFSALLANGSSYQLFDPTSATLSGTKITRTPFPNNVIPTSELNPIALKYMQYFPEPNQPGKSDGENNYVVNDPTTDKYVSYQGRTDLNVSDSNKVFFDYHSSYYTNHSADIFGNLATGQNSNLNLLGSVLDNVHIFSPTLVLDSRLGFSRSYTSSSIKSDGFDPAQLGFPSYLLANSTLPAMPRIAFSDAYSGLSTSPGSVSIFDTLQLYNMATKVVGTHAIKFGADLRRERYSKLSPGYSAGTFTFGTTWVTGTSTASAPPFGGSMASFLLGLPTSGEFDVNEPTTSSNYYYGFFVQDDWKITHNLTLNIGLRAEHETAVVESNNRETIGFNPTAVNQVAQAAASAYAASPTPLLPASAFSATGGLEFASSGNRSGYTTPALFAAPRVGLSWAPSSLHSKTVFRGGFGIFNNPYGAYTTGPSTGFTQSTLLVPTNNSYLTPYATLSNPFPANSILQPTGSSLGINTYLGNSVGYFYPNFKDPYSIRWSFDIQHTFAKDWLVDVGYIGNHQVDLTNTNTLSSAPLIPFLSHSPIKDTAVTNELSAVVPNPFAGLLPGSTLNGTTIGTATLLQAFPEFTGVSESDVPNGIAWFHMLAVRVTKRFSHGLQFNLNYEHSRLLEDSGPLNPGDTKLWYGVPSGDFPDHFVLSGTYSLPFGKGATFLSNVNRLGDALVGGWVLSSIYVWESGAPLSWGNMIYLGGNLDLQPRNLNAAFDTTRFDTVSADQPNAYNYRTFPTSFNNLRSDATNNADISMLKNFRIWEKVRLQYRFEAFNALNRAQFAAPNLTATSKAFATITSQANSARVIQMGLRLTF
jgi:hypothetical protein